MEDEEESDGEEAMRVPISVLVLCVTVACAGTQQRIGMNMPNPSGCYVKVYDQEGFKGTADFISGPRRYASLTDLPNTANWSNRIRSAQVGPIAVVTVWTDAEFEGQSFQMGTDRAYGALIEKFSGQIQSMAVACTPAANGPPA